MKQLLNKAQKCALTLVATVVAGQAMAQVTFYEQDNFQGGSYNAERSVKNMERSGLNARAASAVVVGERWEVCDNNRFRGRCVVLRPGRYASPAQMNLNNGVASVRVVAANARIADNRFAPVPATAEIIFFENAQFLGRTFRVDKQADNFASMGFNDRASSAVVIAGAWEVCADSRFNGQCIVLRPGRYGSLSDMGINDRISSTRMVDWNTQVADDRYAPVPGTVYDSRTRNDERLYQANVTSVRAVVGPPEERCWMEREAIAQVEPPSNANMGGAVVGALLGGILGHQVGGGVGKDIATVGGAVAGAALGSRVGRTADQPVEQARDLKRCTTVPSQAPPAFWDVSYSFKGQEHRIQMTSAPGSTITVNGNGEPRT